MEIAINGTRLWFDAVGSALVPDVARMRPRRTVVLVHGGPGSYDHSYLRPHFDRLSDSAQVVYVDLRDHGRSARHDPAAWTFEACADDLRAFCDALGIDRPIVLGHSMGGIIAMLYGVRHPGRAGGLILVSTMARFDLARLIDGFRRFGGDHVAKLAGRDFGGDPVSDAEWATVLAAFGPNIPSEGELARRIQNPDVGITGMEQLRRLDLLDQLPRVTCPSLICVGDLDPVTPIDCAREILGALPMGSGRLEMIGGAGHFPWLDRPDRLWDAIGPFVAAD